MNLCSGLVVHLLVLLINGLADCGRVRHQTPSPKQALKFLRGIGFNANSRQQTSAIGGGGGGSGGLWPSVFNLATKAVISVNATCGEGGREEFCRMSTVGGAARHYYADSAGGGGGGGGGGRISRCGFCDNFSRDPHKRHPINYAIDDGTNSWWQSPPIFYGAQYEYVTITLDLKQVYQVAYVTLKAANSPRPGAWVLERSIDGVAFAAWQFFATSDKECVDRYGVPARKGKPHYFTDTEVICTSFHSKLLPMENGEVHTFLIHGRPGANETSPELLEFTRARYVRFRLQGLRGKVDPLPAWLADDINRDKKLFYSIRDIRIGGQCVCNGHASTCRHNVAAGQLECECGHHTCGANCDRCCPMYNQRQWGPGSSRDARICSPCNCHGHAKSCHYDEDVDRAGTSLDANNYYQGGGVCDNCTKHTTGINCELCVPGYYRPLGTEPNSEVPCIKCDCDAHGSTGQCALEHNLLTCECRPGYGGLRCDECDVGYRGYPNCEKCPCNPKGTLVEEYNERGACEGECICKTNVEGKYCDRCKIGYFSLQMANREGCSPCYCSGVTTVCSSAFLQPQILTFNNKDNWLVSDISVKEIETPLMDEREFLTVGNNEITGTEAYYWLAPQSYTGNKLSLYGSNLLYKVHWVVMRGDTSGKPTTGPNIILVGSNGMRIACGDDHYITSNMTFLLPLDEYRDIWYHVPDDVEDIITRLRRTEYKGDRVSRSQFMSVLNDIKHILLRAKFHTDQIEVSLEEVVIFSGNFTDGYSPVEECSCPSGYAGRSCEYCQYGYVRIYGNNTKHETQGYCVKCDCNGHSETCNADTGECICEHNTIGEQCERCAVGYYGNPLRGTPNDCRKCACPLDDETNNFSPSCQLDAFSVSNDDVEPGYVCTQCPNGYTGDHCEICDDGYFGMPSVKGGSCEPCSCGGGPCDRLTGQCLSCRGNTEGWKCDRCKEAFFGNPAEGCEPCLCDPQGSISSVCNNHTGECECKEHFVERTCNKCENGYGNVTAQCVQCNCDIVGAISNQCDPTSGMCECHPGVEGFKCDACQHLHYGFSLTGCSSCNCSLRGSELSTCHIVTGQCRCKANYIGRSCDRCRDGYYESASGCVPCDCSEEGSESSQCHSESGFCKCKPGVEGKHCDVCKYGFYGFSKTGCKKCDICTKPGHICDQETGRCSCPPNSYGESCKQCKPKYWGFEPNIGCKSCNCSETGSVRSQCDLRSSICTCNQGYEGTKCDRCAHGYYGYPKCRRCSCHYPGTIRSSCTEDGVCQCDPHGNCPCKSNVTGRRCNTCKDSTFGLHIDNENGCTECFCFRRSKQCTESGYTWSKIRMKNRQLSVGFMDVIYKSPTLPQYIPDNINVNDFEVIEGTNGNVSLANDHYTIPLYWRLPQQFLGDRILSYGGYLRFTTTINPNHGNHHGEFNSYPIVHIEGNDMKLVYDTNFYPISDKYEVQLHENNWRRIYTHGHREEFLPVDRDLIMVVLQNVSDIYIKGTNHGRFQSILLSDVSLDSGIKLSGSPPPLAMQLEKCECPKVYNGTSCQNPSLGNYRDKKYHHIYHNSSDIESVLGKSIPCSCNGRSKICDIETGYCQNCIDNTAGKSCEKCAQGYYGTPESTKCKACLCPSETQNFAISCVPRTHSGHFICKCKKGYYGPTCDRCSPGYYGEPHLPGGSCKPCDCNPEGSTHRECDKITGACSCKPGIVGQKCGECAQMRHVLDDHNCVPCDVCVDILLDKLDDINNLLANNTKHLSNGVVQPPWDTLTDYETKYLTLSDKVEEYLNDKKDAHNIVEYKNIDKLETDVEKIYNEFKSLNSKAHTAQNKIKQNQNRSDRMLEKARNVTKELEQFKKKLDDYETQHVSTKDALKKGHKWNNEIRKQSERMNDFLKVSKVRNQCENAFQAVEKFTNASLHQTRLKNLHQLRLEHVDLKERLQDLRKLINEVNAKNELTTKKSSVNEKKLQAVQKIYKELTDSIRHLHDTLKTSKELVSDVNNKLTDAEIKDYNEMNELIDQLDARITDEYLETLPKQQQNLNNHIVKLSAIAAEYESIFTKLHNDFQTLKNSGKFNESTTDLIKIAKATYEEAQNTFDELVDEFLDPAQGDTISVNSSISKANSDRLRKRAEVIQDTLEKKAHQKKKLENGILTLKASNWDNGLANNNQTEKLNEMKSENAEKLRNMKAIEEIINKAAQNIEKSRIVHKNATDLNITKQYNLLKNWDKYLNLTSADRIKQFQNNIIFTKNLLQNVSSYNGAATSIDVLNQKKKILDKFEGKRSEIDGKLKQLRDNIAKAKHLTSSILIPLNGSTCGRQYKISHLEPTTAFDLVIEFTYNTTEDLQYTIFNLEDIVKLSINNDRLVFSTNTATDKCKFQLDVSDSIYKFTAKIIHNSISTTLSNGDSNPNCNITSQEGFLQFSGNDILEIGDPHGLRGLPGCIKRVHINGKQLSLWNYIYSVGECGSSSIMKDDSSSNSFQFDEGYIAFNQTKAAGSYKFSMNLNIQTFDEDALIFLVYADSKYVAIVLQAGYVVFIMHYNDKAHFTKSTEKKYNDGKEHNLSFARDRANANKTHFVEKAQFKIDKEVFDLENEVVKKDWITILRGNFSVGGIPPNFYTISQLNVTTQPYLGVLNGIFHQKPLSIEHPNSHHNVKYFDIQKQLQYDKVILSTSESFVRLRYPHTEDITTVSFILRPISESGRILNIGKNLEITLKKGKINVYNDGDLIVKSELVNNDEYNFVKFDGTTRLLYVNQEKISGKNAPQWIIKSNEVPILVNIGDEKNSIVGMVNEISLNSEYVTITQDTYVDQKNAQIGRSLPRKVVVKQRNNPPIEEKTNDISMKDMSPQLCEKVSYTIEPNAFKFGDGENSFLSHTLKPHFWKSNYTIEFEIRTFYSEGLLFLAYGTDHYNMLIIKSGTIALEMKGKKKKVIETKIRIDDGKWHRVVLQNINTLQKKKRRLWIEIDGQRLGHKMPQNKITSTLFIGNVPKHLSNKYIVNQLHGCIRSLKINNLPSNITKDKKMKYNQVGQCFSNVERGSYFRGDSYAVYDQQFRLNNYLDIAFDFRTDQQNGILLSVADFSNHPALSIELQNGAVVMSVDMGNGLITNVTNNLARNSACNNEWHKVLASFTTELSVKVDDVATTWVLNGLDEFKPIEAPLYIGGLPDSAPGGTLRIRENFKGCIRNLSIDNKSEEWTRMHELVNVLLNSCPVNKTV